MAEDDQRWLGILLILASTVAFSTAGLFTRLISVDAWTVLFWRGIFAGIFIGAYVVWQSGRQTFAAIRAIGGAGLLAASCSTLATLCFVNSLRLTTVADVTIIGATAPFVTAALAWLFTAERERWTTLAASAAAFIGVAAMMIASARYDRHANGDLLAFAMTVLISAMMVIIRSRRRIPMLPASCLSAFASAAAVLPLANPGAASGSDLVYLALFGTTQFGLGLLLLTLGTRLISATQAALIGAVEIPVAPLWVWLGFDEQPPLMTWVGGVIVMAAVLVDMLCRDRIPRAAAICRPP
jgi:drug/metabolite transporter (DMT)-like permease